MPLLKSIPTISRQSVILSLLLLGSTAVYADSNTVDRLITTMGSFDVAGKFLSDGRECFAEVRSSMDNHSFSVAVFDKEKTYSDQVTINDNTELQYSLITGDTAYVVAGNNRIEAPDSHTFSIGAYTGQPVRVVLQDNRNKKYGECQGTRLPPNSERKKGK